MANGDGFGAWIDFANGRRPLPPHVHGFGGFGDTSDFRITSHDVSGNYATLHAANAAGDIQSATLTGDNGHIWSLPADNHYALEVLWGGGPGLADFKLQLINGQIDSRFTLTVTYTNGTTATTSYNTAAPPNFETFITGLYQEFYNRAPDAGGKTYWIGRAQAEWASRGQAGLNAIREVFRTTPDPAPPATGGGGSTGGGSTGGGSTGGGTTTTGGGIFDTLMNGKLELLGFNIPYWMLLAGGVGAFFVLGDDGPKRRR